MLTILFSADNLTLQCRYYDTYRYTVTLTLGLWQQRTSLRLVPKIITVTKVLSLRSELYMHIITVPEYGEPAYRIYVGTGRRPTKNGTE